MVISKWQCIGLTVFLGGLLSACTSAPPAAVLEASNTQQVDFSGNWELDYGQSDNIQNQLNALLRELRRQQERRSQNGGERRGTAVTVGGGGGTNSGPTILGLAQMADAITEAQLLDIAQSRNDINVKREGNFALTCEFFRGEAEAVENPLGKELCGWTGQQMVFRIYLPEGLSIQHVMSLAPSGERLGIDTTVVSDRVSQPFTLRRVYNRYDPATSGYHCEQTLSRGRVCTTRPPGE
ncbi:MAG: hypothetical protein HRT76_07160 [Halieaceae bacterium]|nr:hypothetical protein [Halieaceae bacterium]